MHWIPESGRRAMLSPHKDLAQFHLVLLSNDIDRARTVRAEFGRSHNRYYFQHFPDRDALPLVIDEFLTAAQSKLPSIVLIDYAFVGAFCEQVLDDVEARGAAKAIACVVLNPPGSADLRRRLTARQARIVDDMDELGASAFAH